jgi:hypothetical protein
MTMGPDEVTVPLASFVSMEQQNWAFSSAGSTRYVTPASTGSGGRVTRGARKTGQGWSDWDGGAAATVKDQMDLAAEATAAPAPMMEDDEWFERDTLESAKRNAR